MSTLSHVHQLFSAKTCHAYLRALRWKDRPFQCPHCHSREVGPWGTYHYRPGFKRYRCKHCGRTFNDLTKTLLSQSKRSLAHWILAPFCCASRVRPVALPGSWAFMSVPATAGAGGCVTPPCPTRRIATWRVPSKQMNSITRPGTRGKRKRGQKALGTPGASSPQEA
jgi:transposase-like protein